MEKSTIIQLTYGYSQKTLTEAPTLGWSLHHFLVVTNCYKGGLDPQFQANMIEVYLEPVNVFYFGSSTFQKRPFPIKTVVIWVSRYMYTYIYKYIYKYIYIKIESKIKYTRYSQNLWFAKRSQQTYWVPYGFAWFFNHSYGMVEWALFFVFVSPPPGFCMVNLVLASTFWMITRWLLIWTQLLTGTRYTLDVAPIMCVGCMNYGALCYKYLIHQSPISKWGEFPAQPRPFLLFKATSP